jgi:hypothetical protein
MGERDVRNFGGGDLEGGYLGELMREMVDLAEKEK